MNKQGGDNSQKNFNWLKMFQLFKKTVMHKGWYILVVRIAKIIIDFQLGLQ